jgi:predicted  nucleic acid-binding Zn-ribbon protein
MANDDLLQQFKKLIEENNKQLRLEIQEDNKAAIKAEVEPLHERFDAQREQISTVEKNIIEQFSPITNMVLDHDEQIGELQKAVGLCPKH